MEIATTGDGADHKLINILRDIQQRIQNQQHLILTGSLIANIESVLTELNKLDSRSGYDRPRTMDIILEPLNSLNFSLKKKNLVQTDLKLNLVDKNLGSVVVNLVLEGIRVLSKISPYEPNK
ncbi:MAG: hypothetical protein ABIT58_05735 [Ferruginibacter sp.]